jgi:hypothetical protein
LPIQCFRTAWNMRAVSVADTRLSPGNALPRHGSPDATEIPLPLRSWKRTSAIQAKLRAYCGHRCGVWEAYRWRWLSPASVASPPSTCRQPDLSPAKRPPPVSPSRSSRFDNVTGEIDLRKHALLMLPNEDGAPYCRCLCAAPQKPKVGLLKRCFVGLKVTYFQAVPADSRSKIDRGIL